MSYAILKISVEVSGVSIDTGIPTFFFFFGIPTFEGVYITSNFMNLLEKIELTLGAVIMQSLLECSC